MNYLRLFLAFFTMVFMLLTRAQSQERQLFDGGMMVHLTFKTDWLVPLPTREMPSCARFYLGVVFAH